MITIKQAAEADISVIESILLDTVNWLNEMDQPLWGVEEVKWDELSRNYKIGDFYIAYLDGTPCGCMAMVDYDPFFWNEDNPCLFMAKWLGFCSVGWMS